MRLSKILLALLLVLTGSGPSALASIPLAPKNPCTGQFRGVVSGLRYYNPAQGRWLGRDVAKEKGGINLFAFVKNNSITHVDPFGKATLSDLGTAAAIGGGLAAAGEANFNEIEEMAEGVVEKEEAIQAVEGMVESAVDGTVADMKQVFRVISDGEAAGIGNSGKFSFPPYGSTPSGNPGKWFFDTLGQAQGFQQFWYKNGTWPSSIVSTTVNPADITSFPDPDGFGDALWVELQNLTGPINFHQ